MSIYTNGFLTHIEFHLVGVQVKQVDSKASLTVPKAPGSSVCRNI